MQNKHFEKKCGAFPEFRKLFDMPTLNISHNAAMQNPLLLKTSLISAAVFKTIKTHIIWVTDRSNLSAPHSRSER